MAKKAFDSIMAGAEDAVAYARGDKTRGKAHTPGGIYHVVDTHTLDSVASGFATREAAKVKRDELNGGKPENDKPGRYIVSRTDEHPRGYSDGTSTMTRGKKSNW